MRPLTCAHRTPSWRSIVTSIISPSPVCRQRRWTIRDARQSICRARPMAVGGAVQLSPVPCLLAHDWRQLPRQRAGDSHRPRPDEMARRNYAHAHRRSGAHPAFEQSRGPMSGPETASRSATQRQLLPRRGGGTQPRREARPAPSSCLWATRRSTDEANAAHPH